MGSVSLRHVRVRLVLVWAVVLALLAGALTPLAPAAAQEAVVATGPAVVHVPVATAPYGRDVAIDAQVRCVDTCTGRLLYRTTDPARAVLELQGWQSRDLTLSAPVASPDGSTVWSATGAVPAAAVTTAGFDYWLEVVEGDQIGTFPLDATETSTAPTYVHTTVLTPPVIRHLPPAFGRHGQDLVVDAEATCATGACEAVLYYRSTDGPIVDEPLNGRPDWASVTMDATVAGTLGAAGERWAFTAAIPGEIVDTRGVDYVIEVTDGHVGAWWPGTAYQGYYQPTDGIRTGYQHVHVLEPPHIVHVPPVTSGFREPIKISAQANCSAPAGCTASLFYRTTQRTVADPVDDFAQVPMTVTVTETLADLDVIEVTGAIPGEVADTRGVDYFFSVSDESATSWWPGTSHVDGYVPVEGTRVGYQHVRVLEPPHVTHVPPAATLPLQDVTIDAQVNCATAECTVELFYGTEFQAIGDPGYTRVEMQPTGAPVDTARGQQTGYRAVIPAQDVTTTGLAYYIRAHDGFTTGYGPGTSYWGAYVPVDGSRGDQLVVGGQTVGLAGEGDIDLGPGIASLDLGGGAVYPLRVLEPPHPVGVPDTLAERLQPYTARVVSNCAIGDCEATLTWLDSDGEQHDEPMTVAVGVDGLAAWEFTLGREATDQDLLQWWATVDDGYAATRTPTVVTPLDETLSMGGVGGGLWWDLERDHHQGPFEPVIDGARVELVQQLPLGLTGLTYEQTTVDGTFRFTRVLPGDYMLRVDPDTLPVGVDLADIDLERPVSVELTVLDEPFAFAAADTDTDGVLDVIEDRFGVTPGSLDTDGDGLTDTFEFGDSAIGVLDPTDPDSDGDGIGDASEDVEGDGLDNLAEQTAGTDPGLADSDGDELDDATEVTTSGTDPTSADTDGDTLPDGQELRNGLDPLLVDTDNDGILDPDETLTVPVDTPSGVDIVLHGEGDLDRALTIDATAQSALVGELLSDVYDIHFDDTNATMAAADLSITVDPADVEPGSRPWLFTYDDSRGIWVPGTGHVNYDPATGTVTGTVEHFSAWAVMDLDRWLELLVELPECQADTSARDYLLVLDGSGSMAGTEQARADAANALIDRLDPLDRIGIVQFNDAASDLHELSFDHDAARASLAGISSGGGTNIGQGVNRALTMLDDRPAVRHMLVLSDGYGSYDPALTQQAIDQNVFIHTIGFKRASETQLRSISEPTGGIYRHVDDAEDLADTFALYDILAEDIDADGLLDCEEDRYGTDRFDPDSDGDDAPDGFEAGEPTIIDAQALFQDESFGVLLRGAFPDWQTIDELAGRTRRSDPTDPDTDNDGLDDGTEHAEGSDPRVADGDRDGANDRVELREWGTDPDNPDTDDDGFDDGYEIDNANTGLSPTVFNLPPESRALALGHFTMGLTCGDFCFRDTIPWFLGSVAIGFFAVGDVRDALAALWNGDLVGVAISAFGIIPFVGDAVRFGDSAITFWRRTSPQRAGDFLQWVVRQDNLPVGVRAGVIEATESAGYNAAKSVNPPIGNDALVRLATGSNNLERIADAVRRSNNLPLNATQRETLLMNGKKLSGLDGGRLAFDPRGAEAAIRRGRGANAHPGVRQTPLVDETGAPARLRPCTDQGCPDPNAPFFTTHRRDVDVFTDDGFRIADEVKSGRQRLSGRLQQQIAKDKELLRLRQVDSVIWHFVPNASGVVDVHPRLLDALDQAGIPYRIWLPE